MTTNNPNIIENKNIAIDVSILYYISGNDESFIGAMVQTFLKTMPETIKELEQSLSDRDWENVYRYAHFAKSSLSIIKIGEVLDWVVQVEVNAKNETDLDILPELVEKIKEKYSLAAVMLNEKFNAEG